MTNHEAISKDFQCFEKDVAASNRYFNISIQITINIWQSYQDSVHAENIAHCNNKSVITNANIYV